MLILKLSNRQGLAWCDQFSDVVNTAICTLEVVLFYISIIIINFHSKGRNGKGVIYVWAAGNGGQNGDSCAMDGYVSSIYTIAVGSVDQYGHQAPYDEDCSSKLAVTVNHNGNREGGDYVVSIYFSETLYSTAVTFGLLTVVNCTFITKKYIKKK